MPFGLKSKDEVSEMCSSLMAMLPIPKSMKDEHRLLSILPDKSAGIWIETQTNYGYFNFTSPNENKDYVGLTSTYEPLLGKQACWYNFNKNDVVRL